MPATITKVRYLIDGGSASVSVNGKTVKRRYLATVAEKFADPFEVALAVHDDMPAHGQQDEYDGSLIVTNKDAARARTKAGQPADHLWTIDVEWSVPPSIGGGISGPSGETTNSQNIRVRITGVEQSILTQRARDEDETPIRNAAGDMYPDPVEVDLYDTAIDVEYETASIDNATWDAAQGKINDAEVTLNLPQGPLTYSRTFPKHTLKLKTADREVIFSKSDPTAAKWRNRVLLLYREDTWNKRLPEKGYRWLVGTDDGEKFTAYQDHPEYLDENGFKLEAGQPLALTPPQQLDYEHDLVTVLGTI